MRSATFERIQAIARILHSINEGNPLTDRDWEMIRIIRSLTVDFDRVLAVLDLLGTIDRPTSTADLQKVLGVSASTVRDTMRAIGSEYPLVVDDRGKEGYWYQPIVLSENLKLLMEAMR